MQEIPDHVRRIIDRDGPIDFRPPSFERWLGRLAMLRTLASMGSFTIVWLASYGSGKTWDEATVRAIVASLAFFFLAWAAGLFIFGEIYDSEVKRARTDLEERERERTRRIETYYRDRLRQEGLLDDGAESIDDTIVAGFQPRQPATVTPIGTTPMTQVQPEAQRQAA